MRRRCHRRLGRRYGAMHDGVYRVSWRGGGLRGTPSHRRIDAAFLFALSLPACVSISCSSVFFRLKRRLEHCRVALLTPQYLYSNVAANFVFISMPFNIILVALGGHPCVEAWGVEAPSEKTLKPVLSVAFCGRERKAITYRRLSSYVMNLFVCHFIMLTLSSRGG